jgi:hypothetical protein
LIAFRKRKLVNQCGVRGHVGVRTAQVIGTAGGSQRARSRTYCASLRA